MMTRRRRRDDLDAAGYSPEVQGYQKASQGMRIGCAVWFRRNLSMWSVCVEVEVRSEMRKSPRGLAPVRWVRAGDNSNSVSDNESAAACRLMWAIQKRVTRLW